MTPFACTQHILKDIVEENGDNGAGKYRSQVCDGEEDGGEVSVGMVGRCL